MAAVLISARNRADAGGLCICRIGGDADPCGLCVSAGTGLSGTGDCYERIEGIGEISHGISEEKKKSCMPAVYFCDYVFMHAVIKGDLRSESAAGGDGKAGKRALGHMVEAEGMVTANREVAVDTVSGLKVNQIYVNLGDSVSANTLLFDVDQEDLKEKISEQELAIKKLEMSNEQARQQKELDAQKERLAQNRSLEDYALADTEEDRKIEQAGDAVAKAEEKLDDHLNNQPRQTPDEERNQKKRSIRTGTAG